MAVVMTPAGQRAALVALLATVPGIGVVHDYRRTVKNENEIRQLLVPSGNLEGQVNAWMIYPAPSSTTVTERNPGHHGKGVLGGGNVFTTMQWAIDFYHYIDDAAATEKTAFDLAWAVADQMNGYGQLAIDGITHQLPADVEFFGFIMLGNFAFYHYGRIGVGFKGRTRPV